MPDFAIHRDGSGLIFDLVSAIGPPTHTGIDADGFFGRHRLESTDLSSKKRIVRALEIAHHAREHELQYSPPPVAIDHKLFVLDFPAETLGERIDRRLEERMQAGMADEIQRLLEDLRHGIRRLAKRQRTWFRGMERRGVDTTWIDHSGCEAMLDWARETGPTAVA